MATTDSPEFDTIEGKQVPSLVNRRIGDGRYHLRDRLGSGGYSVVYLAVDLHSPRRKKVAIKCLLFETDNQKAKIRRELSLHGQACGLPGVIDIYHTVEEMGLYFIVLEFCPDGDLFSMVTDTRLYLGRDDLVKNVFLQLLDTVHALHRKGIFHRDLKPENILCFKGGRVLRISDFGLATSTEKSTNFGCGSYFYMSPECIAGYYTNGVTSYSSRATDIWALGVILVNLITSRSPWKSAVLTDPSYARYTRNRHWLRQMLPLSRAAFTFLDKIFANHGNYLSLTQLRAEFVAIETFYMSVAELEAADPTARLVAKDWAYDTPTEDIRDEDIAGSVDGQQLFEDPAPAAQTPPSPPSDTPDTLSPISPDSVLYTESAPAILGTANIDPTSIVALAEELMVENVENTANEQIEVVPMSSSSSNDSSSSASDSDAVITPESLPVQNVDVVPDLPTEALGEKLVVAAPAEKKRNLNAVKSVVAVGERLLSKVRFVL